MARNKNTDVTITTRVRDLASKDLRNVGETGRKAGQSIAAGFIKAQLALGAMKAAARGLASFFRGITTEAIKEGDAISKMGRQFGIATETLSSWRHVADLAGSSMAGIGRAMQNLGRNMLDAERGLVTPIDMFRELGFEIHDSEGQLKSIDSAMLELADTLGGMEDKTRRTGIAMKVFGQRAGLQMVNVLEQGSDAIREQIKEAERLGIVWTTAEGRMAEGALDAITRFNRAIDGIKNSIAKELLPTVEATFNALAEYIAENRDAIRTTMVDIIKGAVEGIISFAKFAAELAGDLKDAIQAAKDFFEDPLGGVGRAFKGAVDPTAGMGVLSTGGMFSEASSTGEKWRRQIEEVERDIREKIGVVVSKVTEQIGNTGRTIRVEMGEGVALTAEMGEGIEKISAEFEKQIDLLREQDTRKRQILKIDQEIAAVFQALEEQGADLFDPAVLNLFALAEQLRALKIEEIDLAAAAEKMREANAEAEAEMVRLAEAAAVAAEQLDPVLTEMQEFSNALRDTFVSSGASAITSFFGSITLGAQSASDAFADMARSFLRSVAEMASHWAFRQILGAGLSAIGWGTAQAAPTSGAGAPQWWSDMPMVTQQASGGITTGPGLFLRGERSKREAVLPLESPGGRRALSQAMTDAGGGIGAVNITIMQQPGESSEDLANRVLAKIRASSGAKRQFRQTLRGGLLG